MAMEKKFMKCSPSLPVFEAARLLLGVGRRNLIIVDKDNRMLGTLSVSDILRYVITSGSDWKTALIEEIMKTDFFYLPENHSREDAVKLFVKYKIDYLPILNENNNLSGMRFVHDYL